jgi:hypothetical protein
VADCNKTLAAAPRLWFVGRNVSGRLSCAAAAAATLLLLQWLTATRRSRLR